MLIRTYRVVVWPKLIVTELPATAGLNVYVADADDVGERRAVGAALHAQRLGAGAPAGGRQLEHDPVDATRRAEVDRSPTPGRSC